MREKEFWDFYSEIYDEKRKDFDLSIGMLKRAEEKVKNGKVYLINMNAHDIDLSLQHLT